MINETQNKIIGDMIANYRAISKLESNFIYVTNIRGKKLEYMEKLWLWY
jgi:hypothetical protein